MATTCKYFWNNSFPNTENCSLQCWRVASWKPNGKAAKWCKVQHKHKQPSGQLSGRAYRVNCVPLETGKRSHACCSAVEYYTNPSSLCPQNPKKVRLMPVTLKTLLQKTLVPNLLYVVYVMFIENLFYTYRSGKPNFSLTLSEFGPVWALQVL